MLERIWEDLLDGGLDTLKMLPFMLAAFLLLEALEKYSETHRDKMMTGIRHSGPVIGALFGAFPQCGFSVAAANLYAGGVVTLGTLLAVFLATSDEAVLLILAEPGRAKEVLPLLIFKIILGTVWGLLIDLAFLKSPMRKKQIGEICEDCGCEEEDNLLKAALHHTIEVFLYLLVFNCVLSILLDLVGIESLSTFLLKDSVLQPVMAAMVGLIPNCAASVALTRMYLSGVLSFASVMAGLLSGAGVGLAVLFKINKNRKENLKIVGILFACAAVTGIILELAGSLLSF